MYMYEVPSKSLEQRSNPACALCMLFLLGCDGRCASTRHKSQL